MSYNLLLQDEAIKEIQDAFQWYAQQRIGLGYEFVDQVEKSFQKLAVAPEYYTQVANIYCRIKLKRFLYLIIYEISGTDIIVVQVKHIKQKFSF